MSFLACFNKNLLSDMLYDTVTGALQGRVWNGKEKLLEAVSAVLRSSGGKSALKWDEVTTEKVIIFHATFQDCKSNFAFTSPHQLRWCVSDFDFHLLIARTALSGLLTVLITGILPSFFKREKELRLCRIEPRNHCY